MSNRTAPETAWLALPTHRHLDEVFVTLRGESWLLWCAIDEHGAELDAGAVSSAWRRAVFSWGGIGAIADVSGWRSVYLAASMAMLGLAVVLWWRLPVPERHGSTLSYPRLIASMFGLLRRDRVLRIRGTLVLLMFAAFNIFWSALVFPLTAAPYGFSHTVVGAFGIVGAIAAMRAGAWADHGLPMAQRALRRWR